MLPSHLSNWFGSCVKPPAETVQVGVPCGSWHFAGPSASRAQHAGGWWWLAAFLTSSKAWEHTRKPSHFLNDDKAQMQLSKGNLTAFAQRIERTSSNAYITKLTVFSDFLGMVLGMQTDDLTPPVSPFQHSKQFLSIPCLDPEQ